MSSRQVQLSREKLLATLGSEWPEHQLEEAVEILASEAGRFPPGMRRLSPELTAAIQRQRLIEGMVLAASKLGYRCANVQDVIDRAGVSRPVFYEHFSNKEDCFLAAFDTSAQRLRDKLETAALQGGDVWRDRLRFGIQELLRFAAAELAATRAIFVEAQSANVDAALRHAALLDYFAGCIDAKAQKLLTSVPDNSAIVAAGVAGGIAAVLSSRFHSGELEDLQSLLPSLMHFAVLPYEGREAADEELALETD